MESAKESYRILPIGIYINDATYHFRKFHFEGFHAGVLLGLQLLRAPPFVQVDVRHRRGTLQEDEVDRRPQNDQRQHK